MTDIQSPAERMFSAKIRDAESLMGKERQRLLKVLAKFFRPAAEKYVAHGGELAADLAAYLTKDNRALVKDAANV